MFVQNILLIKKKSQNRSALFYSIKEKDAPIKLEREWEQEWENKRDREGDWKRMQVRENEREI